jgi:RNA recognition motif. (a.k.a. RRM, RBD, or RNP domain)
MYRAYIGNLDSEVTEEMLCELLRQRNITTTAIVLKRGYAFIDCPDSKSFQTAIGQLNGICSF